MKSQISRPGRFVAQQKSVEIAVDQLQIGMFVSRLDCAWTETPFLLQGFLVESQGHIDEIAKYCQTVWVDRVGDEWITPQSQAVLETASQKNLIHKIPAQDEHARALNTYKHSRQVTKTLLDEVRLGGAIDSEAAKESVSACVDSILQNPDAMLWMSRIREAHNYTVEHSLNVCVLAIAFGRYLGMEETELNKLGLCGMLQDVGKMKIPEVILNKPGDLNDDEWLAIREHATFGRDLLMSTPGIYEGAIDVAYSHHERIDGKGYPRGLKGAAISNYARIVSIVDAYDAMTADRCYAPARTSTDALKILYENKDIHFDGSLIDHFMRMIGLYPPGSIIELINGEVALVLASNHKYQHLPKVIRVLDSGKEKCAEKIYNLADIDKGTLGEEFFIRKAHTDGSFGIRMCEYQEKGLQFSYNSQPRKAI